LSVLKRKCGLICACRAFSSIDVANCVWRSSSETSNCVESSFARPSAIVTWVSFSNLASV
jgi:hypothetical protein